MKKSVWTGYLWEESPEEMVDLFEKAGYQYAELSIEHGKMLLLRAEIISIK